MSMYRPKHSPHCTVIIFKFRIFSNRNTHATNKTSSHMHFCNTNQSHRRQLPSKRKYYQELKVVLMWILFGKLELVKNFNWNFIKFKRLSSTFFWFTFLNHFFFQEFNWRSARYRESHGDNRSKMCLLLHTQPPFCCSNYTRLPRPRNIHTSRARSHSYRLRGIVWTRTRQANGAGSSATMLWTEQIWMKAKQQSHEPNEEKNTQKAHT